MMTKAEKSEQPAKHFGRQLTPLLTSAPIWLIFILGIWLIVLKGFGPNWEFVPGDLGDGRFNNYVLEHFFLWVKQANWTVSYWNASFFYPSLGTMAFSDNLWGSAPLYALFRAFGLSRETAFQSWYLCGFIFNYSAAAYVLSRAGFKPLAIGMGAFFFTFGINLLAQGGHLQLYYRFGVPLACFFLLEFFNRPKLTHLAVVAFWLIWQFYLSIYLGFFLTLLLGALMVVAPFFETGISLRARLLQWPNKIKQAWNQASLKERTISLFVIGVAGVFFLALIWPYYKISKEYGFVRRWKEASLLLPHPESFFLADASVFWKPVSSLFDKNFTVRYEQQLFPGIAIFLIVLTGIAVRFKSKNHQMAWLYFWSIIVLIVITLNVNGYSLYWFIWNIPGISSIRAMARIQMVWVWPLSFFAAWVIDAMLQYAPQRKAGWLLYIGVFLLATLLITESTSFPLGHYLKADGIARLTNIKLHLPTKLPDDPILVVATPDRPHYATEIDAMLTAQELGWPTLNGYSGNTPPYFQHIGTCIQIHRVITRYTEFKQLKGEKKIAVYEEIRKRIVPVLFDNCDMDQQITTP